ncbi:YciI family protein [Brachybacterium phenoliresistens]|uniref:YciI family protein n=1 Tax=Brachybacterium phenoliresistens TaxID=396014 RepID=UPI0031D2D411
MTGRSGPVATEKLDEELRTMKYVLLMMGAVDGPSCGEDDAPGVEDFMAFDAELEKAGVLAGGFALEDPETGTSVTRAGRDAEPVVTAGPYVESREFVGGTIVIDVPDIDEAIRWAGRCPGAIGGRVEVRPIAEF